MAAVLQVATPAGASGKIHRGAGDYLFRYHDDARVQAVILLNL
jgi:serine/threonine-protein kinase HipA